MTINKRSLVRAKARLMKQLHELLPFCRGTLSATTVTCGKPSCACARDPARRHGPYFQWTVVEQGTVRHRTVRPAEAEAVRAGIARRAALEAWCRRFARHMEAEAIAGVVKKNGTLYDARALRAADEEGWQTARTTAGREVEARSNAAAQHVHEAPCGPVCAAPMTCQACVRAGS